MTMPTLLDVIAAAERLRGRIVRTPLVSSPSLSGTRTSSVFLKLETHQTTGSFKLRGVSNMLLLSGQNAKGFVAASTGNHARALAYAAQQMGKPCTVCMSKLVPENKVQAVQALGANIKIVGASQDDAQEEVDRLVLSEGLLAVPPFDDKRVIAGQGTIALEILAENPHIDTLLVPLSGGGLAGGIAMAAKSIKPSVRVIGISMAKGAAMVASLQAGKPVTVTEEPSLADSLGGGIGIPNHYTFDLCKTYLDDTLLLTEDEIAAGIRHAYRYEQEIVEGAGAVGIAALLADKVRSSGTVAVVVSGKNIDMAVHQALISENQKI
ncbi:hydroxyectoine utilization dehydratase EutB [Acetobacter pomorum]|uniref:Hydroxyectoine utilization dehydratase EutB n=1 Tax=Acetobacter pomorum TaxID=65959 RepID=A0A2G4R9J9_9PROT|nr:hydroxyectoine utilization dehydratase EutB [Acetobacter pomorum]PHY93248.1 hydroxyectoine utilization dehydratase EutB [Acetobacter pomorum]